MSLNHVRPTVVSNGATTVKVTPDEDGVTAIDRARRSVCVETGHEPTLERGGYLFADRETVAYEADETVRVETDRLRTSPVGVTVIDPDSGEHSRLTDDEPMAVGPDTVVSGE